MNASKGTPPRIIPPKTKLGSFPLKVCTPLNLLFRSLAYKETVPFGSSFFELFNNSLAKAFSFNFSLRRRVLVLIAQFEIDLLAMLEKFAFVVFFLHGFTAANRRIDTRNVYQLDPHNIPGFQWHIG